MIICLMLLTLTQLITMILCLGLAREIYSSKQKRSGRDEWPLANISPGETIAALREAFNGANLTTETSFVLCVVSTMGLGGIVKAMAAISKDWNHALFLVATNPDVLPALSHWCSEASDDRIKVLDIPAANLGISTNTILYVKNSRVLEATSSMNQDLVMRFSFVAGA